jgi:hypothetical protein
MRVLLCLLCALLLCASAGCAHTLDPAKIRYRSETCMPVEIMWAGARVTTWDCTIGR